MSKTKTITALSVIAVLAIVGVLGAMTFQSVSAQTPIETPQSPGQNGVTNPAKPYMRGHMGSDNQEALASALGVDLTTLQAAQETAVKQALEQAVSQGLITQAQADQMAARGFMGGFGFGKGSLGDSGIDYDALLAGALNISVDELNAARQQAMNVTIDEAVAAGTITQEQADLMKGQHALNNDEKFQSNMQAAFEAAVQQAVTDGVITQAQAEQILAVRSERGGFMGRGMFMGRGGMGGGEMMPGGMGRHHGGFRFAPNTTPQDESTPSTSGTGLDL